MSKKPTSKINTQFASVLSDIRAADKRAKEIKAQLREANGVELEAPFNYSHPSSRCPKHVSPISKRQLFHSFKTTERFLIRSGVYGTKMVCKHCGGFIKGIEDYTVTAALFSR